jgi:hypothetical protein
MLAPFLIDELTVALLNRDASRQEDMQRRQASDQSRATLHDNPFASILTGPCPPNADHRAVRASHHHGDSTSPETCGRDRERGADPFHHD